MHEDLESRIRTLKNRRERVLERVCGTNIPTTVTDEIKNLLFESEYHRVISCETRLKLYKKLAQLNVSDEEFFNTIKRLKVLAEKQLEEKETQLDELEIIIELLNGNKGILAFCF